MVLLENGVKMNRISSHPVLDQKDNNKNVIFTFDGKKLSGFDGEMVSSALFANGIKEFSIHKKDDAPQGIFCANGQCSQCTVIIDGVPLKSCVTPLREGMEVRTMHHLPQLPENDEKLGGTFIRKFDCDILVVGAGPSGLTSTIELAKQGFNIILVEDKEELGGKLLLQTHKFFGSQEDSYAGTRGFDIGHLLEKEVRAFENVTVLNNSSIVAVYKDQTAGVFIDNKNYATISFEGIVISAGAREKSLIFPGNDLPGVYGAGAFQTLVNRDMIKASDRVFIIGSGNVGLIGAYHALQAGIVPVGIVEIMDHVNGYKVHGDKIKRMGVPIYLNTTVLSVEGDGKVERVTIAKVDDKWNPILETAQTFEVDTVLIATGLTPVDEFYQMAKEYDFKVIKAGDADEIAEASSAMFGGRIAGLKMAKILGKDVVVSEEWYEKAEILKSRPGKVFDEEKVELSDSFIPLFHCVQEIPCNPCTTICPKNAITLQGSHGNIMDIPRLTGECIGCGMCVAICPGLAITLGKKIDAEFAEVMLPYEFVIDFKVGDKLKITDIDGNLLEKAQLVKITQNKRFKTNLITVKMTVKNAAKAVGVVVLKDEDIKPLAKAEYNYLPDNGIVCRCEKVSVGEIVDFIKEYHVRDVNQLKQIRVGMGACGSKTCSVLLPRIFGMAGVDWQEVTPGKLRPLTVEIPMSALVNEENGL